MKRKICIILLICLLGVLCPLCLGASSASPEDVSQSTITTPEVSEEEIIAEDFNTRAKEWLSNILGTLGIGLDALLIALLSKKNKQSVAVTVNDANTQEKLDTLAAENANLKSILVDVVQLQKGTFDVLTALFEDNKGVEVKVRDVISAIHTNTDDIIKDVNQILDAETHKKVKSSIENISHIVLG